MLEIVLSQRVDSKLLDAIRLRAIVLNHLRDNQCTPQMSTSFLELSNKLSA